MWQQLMQMLMPGMNQEQQTPPIVPAQSPSINDSGATQSNPALSALSQQNLWSNFGGR